MSNLFHKIRRLPDVFFLYAIIIFLFVIFLMFVFQNMLPFNQTEQAETNTQVAINQETANKQTTNPATTNQNAIDLTTDSNNAVASDEVSTPDELMTNDLLSDKPIINRDSSTLNLEPTESVNQPNTQALASTNDIPEYTKSSLLINNLDNSPDAIDTTKDNKKIKEYSDATPDSLKETNQDIVKSVESLPAYRQLRSFLISGSLIKNTVKAIHGVAQGQLIRQNRPINLPAGEFISEEVYNSKGSFVVGLTNYRRYDIYIRALNLTKPETIAALYQRYAFEFESEYKNLIGPSINTNFETTLISALDRFLYSPGISENARLYPSSDGYKFIDENYENLPSTSKILFRMGEENKKTLIRWLSAFKLAIETNR